jgi:hypothetical protein
MPEEDNKSSNGEGELSNDLRTGINQAASG